MSKSCTYEGREYSDGAVICQSGREYRCQDGSWEDMATDCEGTGVESGLQNRLISIASVNEGTYSLDVMPPDAIYQYEDVDEEEWKTSSAFFRQNPPNIDSSYPRFTIEEDSTIRVSHGSSGGGRLKNTTLIGSGGKYEFSNHGSYNLKAGTYSHYVNGKVTNRGELWSKVRYKVK